MSDAAATLPAAVRSACLERLATALSGYPELELHVRSEGPAPWLAASNTAVPVLSERITTADTGDGLAYFWSWGERIGDVSDPGTAAHAIAYVLAARDARLDWQGGMGQPLDEAAGSLGTSGPVTNETK